MQYIHSLTVNDKKYVLWRLGEYQYQIEGINWSSKPLLMEYYDAIDFFNRFIECRKELI